MSDTLYHPTHSIQSHHHHMSYSHIIITFLPDAGGDIGARVQSHVSHMTRLKSGQGQSNGLHWLPLLVGLVGLVGNSQCVSSEVYEADPDRLLATRV